MTRRLALACGMWGAIGLTVAGRPLADAQEKSPVHVTARAVGVKPPELLVAPFDSGKARSASKACGLFLKTAEEQKNAIGMKLTLIPPGEFRMGLSPVQLQKVSRTEADFVKANGDRRLTQHRVRITRPFYLGMHEVTKGQFRKFVEDIDYKTDAERDGNDGYGYVANAADAFPFDQRTGFTWRDWGVAQSDDSPVVNVSHNDAEAFCRWLSKREGKQYRLPIEGEWEYACRAGTTSLYYCGDDPEDLTKIGNVADGAALEKFPLWDFTVFSSDHAAFTSPVGRYLPNNFGVYDMTGNARESCEDWYDQGYYAKSPVNDPQGPSSGSTHVCCGAPVGAMLHSAIREGDTSDYRSCFLGFRVVAVPPGQ
jgi:sulfatase modifying factor 1